MSRTIEEILATLSIEDLSELCDLLGAPVGGVLTPISDKNARKVFISALMMLGEWAREAAELPPTRPQPKEKDRKKGPGVI